VKVGLGTVQFGLDYGVSNDKGRTPPEEAEQILDFAASAGVQILDTSPSYGCSEQVLGAGAGRAEQFRVVTKTRPNVADARALTDDLEGSLQRLDRSSVYGLLVHRCADLLSDRGAALYAELVRLKESELVKKIGVSVYNAVEIDAVLEKYSVDIIQVPISVLDQRLLTSGHLRKIKELGIEVHARSVFLQGLLLMHPDHLPLRMKPLDEYLRSYRQYLAERGLTPVEAALNFVLQLPEIDVVVCGVNTLSQFAEIVNAARTSVNTMGWEMFANDEERFWNPTMWS
jgi:aryl-alcohol dehydrogenase-like predicted oxidoreductase